MSKQHQPAETLAQKQQLLSGKKIPSEVIDVVNAINSLAIESSDVIHIFPSFFGHTKTFAISVNAASTDYQEGCDQPELMRELLLLDDEDALQELLSIESQLTELVIDAREQAEGILCTMPQ